jgi:quinoprotein glucose dehydrogenase
MTFGTEKCLRTDCSNYKKWKENRCCRAGDQVCFIYLFDRNTGQPIYPVHEIQVPTESELAGEVLSPTQPVPSLPLPFARQSLTENDLNRLVPDSSYQDIKKRLANYKTGNMFNAPSREGTVIFPGFDGGGEWVVQI